MASEKVAGLFSGFSKLTKMERFTRLMEMGALSKEDVALLNSEKNLDTNLAENFIENVIGYLHMPLGVAANFRIDGTDLAIPMAVEETSIVAAASKTAKWIRDQGEITTAIKGNVSIGQIHIAKVSDFEKFSTIISEHKEELIDDVNINVVNGLVKRGGGLRDIQIRKLTRIDGLISAVLHLLVDTCDAMGANMITQACEYLKTPIQLLTGETVTLCILSNLNDTKLTQANVIIRNIDPELGEKIVEASIFAESDSYRACTNNKGALNGMDPILLATGNDWRALEAAVHAYACRDGQYRSITKWRMEGANLIGALEAPIMVGIVGGMTRLHPTAKICLKMMNVQSADNLSRIVAAVGLAQNLGAIKALVTFGFIEGHMKLHISNLMLGTDANHTEIPLLERQLKQILSQSKKISLSIAKETLNKMRKKELQAVDCF